MALTADRSGASLSLEQRLAAAWGRLPGAVGGAIVGVSVVGDRQTAATGLADAETNRELRSTDRLPVASLTKPTVATACARLWQRQGLPLDTALVDLLPDLAADWRASPRLSLTHLLSHTSGLRRDVTPDELASYDGRPDALAGNARATVHRGQTYRLGAAWRYCNAGYALAGHALAIVSGAGAQTLTGGGFETALAAEVLAPAGMTGAGFEPADAVGHAAARPVRERYAPARRPAGGLVCTVDDVLSLAEFALADPTFAATGVPVAWSTMGSAYALGWNVELGGRLRWHGGDWGGCHAMLLIDATLRAAVAVLTNDDAAAGLRSELAWAELGRLAGLRRGRLGPAVRTAVSVGRLAVASTAAKVFPRTLTW